MRKHVLQAAAGDPARLDDFLAARLGLEVDEARRWIARGGVQVGGRRADRSTVVAPGLRVLARSPDEHGGAPVWRVAYHDDAILLVDKPAGLASQASAGEGARTLERLVGAKHPGAILLHRLDRDASGLTLFALRREQLPALQEALATGAIERRYVAVAWGKLEGAQEIRLRIARHARDARLRIALPEAASGGQAALTRVTPLGAAAGGRATAIAVDLATGRTHQIRLHLAAIGHPLVGDRLYGGPAAPRLLLHGTAIALAHPATGRRIAVVSPPPDGFSPDGAAAAPERIDDAGDER